MRTTRSPCCATLGSMNRFWIASQTPMCLWRLCPGPCTYDFCEHTSITVFAVPFPTLPWRHFALEARLAHQERELLRLNHAVGRLVETIRAWLKHLNWFCTTPLPWSVCVGDLRADGVCTTSFFPFSSRYMICD